MDRISELRRRVELGITKQQYTDLYKLVKNQQKVDQQLMYSKALNIVDKKMIGMWHVVDKIVELEAVLEEIPALQWYLISIDSYKFIKLECGRSWSRSAGLSSFRRLGSRSRWSLAESYY